MHLWLWCCCFALLAVSLVQSDDEVDTFTTLIEKWMLDSHNEEEVRSFEAMIKQMSLKGYGHRISFTDLPINEEKRTCLLCKSSVQAGLNVYRRKQLTGDQLMVVSEHLCGVISGYTEYICKGLVNLNLPIFLYIVDHEPRVNASSICGMIFQSDDPADCPLEDERFEFTIDIPERPTDLKNDKQVGAETKPKGKPLKILHLTDAHLDLKYMPGSFASCDAPCCCRKDVKPLPKSTKAGYWGDYGTCDTPVWAFNDILDQIKEKHIEFDFIYYTGDIVDHSVWETTYASIEEEIRYVSENFRKTFGNTIIYPIIGNHEAQPMNTFAPYNVTETNLTTKWLYDLLAEEWSHWLSEDTLKSMRQTGYYTTLVRPGFRVIALNSNVGYRFNWWAILYPQDPNNQLKWLVDTLLEAEKAGEIVHILSHIPPGTKETYRPWGREYKRIISRFSHIIAAEFNGHTHTDEFKVVYDDVDINKPTYVAWNGGGMVTFVGFNVNYKIMDVNSDTFVPLDITTYTYNLTEANLTPDKRPRWYKSYSFKEEYGVDSLEAKDMDKLVSRFATSKDLLDKYIFNYGKQSDAFLMEVESHRTKYGLDFDFRFVCDMVTTSLDDKRKCHEMKTRFTASRG